MRVNEFPDRLINIDNKPYLYFGGTSYLGLATHKGFQELIIEGLKKWGTFYGSSRNANIKLSVYDLAEDMLAKWIKAEVTVTVSSGALAGKLVLDYLSKSNPVFYHYPKTHPAIIAKDSLPLFLNGIFHPKLLDDKIEDIVISADAVLALEVFPTSFKFLDDIPEHKNVTLLLDESHSIGILGTNGRGVFSEVNPKRHIRKIVVASIGKALGLSGGFIGGEENVISAVKKEAAFVSSSGANPAYLHAFLKGQQFYKFQSERLSSNMSFLFSRLNKTICSIHNENYPVLYFQKNGFYQNLLEQQIVITSFEYPSYDLPMNRVVITANHTKEDLEVLAKTLNSLV